VRKRRQLPAYSSTLAEYREAAARPGGDAYRFWIPPSTAIKPRHRDELRRLHLGDWAWFREHPHRHFRIRHADPAEAGSHVVVKQAQPWALVRVSVTVGARDHDKSLARLFDTDCPQTTRAAEAALDDGRAE
jgi:hypothetical protein